MASDAYVGEIRIFPIAFPDGDPPVGWARCDGRMFSPKQFSLLFSVLGTTYGGDGVSTFALPDLRGRVPMHPGQGEGLSLRKLGEQGGDAKVTLAEGEMPIHTHSMSMSLRGSDNIEPQGLSLGTGNNVYAVRTQAPTSMSKRALQPAGAGLGHNNMQPYLALCFCIAMIGNPPTAA